MSTRNAFLIIVFLALGGAVFSGYLSYYSLFTDGCSEAIISCGGNQPVEIFGVANCVYGFAMFFVTLVLALIGLKRLPKGIMTAILVIGVAGSLFALGLTIYELWIAETVTSGLPSCAYGFLFYLAILIVSIIGRRSYPIAPVSAESQTPRV